MEKEQEVKIKSQSQSQSKNIDENMDMRALVMNTIVQLSEIISLENELAKSRRFKDMAQLIATKNMISSRLNAFSKNIEERVSIDEAEEIKDALRNLKELMHANKQILGTLKLTSAVRLQVAKESVRKALKDKHPETYNNAGIFSMNKRQPSNYSTVTQNI